MKKELLMPVLSIALAAAVLFALASCLAPIRERKEQAQLENAMKSVLPGAEVFTREPVSDDEMIRAAYKSENGYVIQAVTAGYAGEISMLVGVRSDGSVAGLMVQELHETYGLGRRALRDQSFLSQFWNTKGDAQVGTNVDALTGATVTSKAITRAVNAAASYVTGADASSSATTWGG